MPVETAPVSCDAVASKIFDAGDAENVAAISYLQKTHSLPLSPEVGCAKDAHHLGERTLLNVEQATLELSA
jgi:hypothetical protein